jgi:hypothetical protein
MISMISALSWSDMVVLLIVEVAAGAKNTLAGTAEKMSTLLSST